MLPPSSGVGLTVPGVTARDACANRVAIWPVELGGYEIAWTVRFGPLPRDEMRAVLDRFAW
jgi:hypothetical protein